MYRKRWRNSIHNCQAFSTSIPIGSDHRIVSAFVKLSLRVPKPARTKKLYWQALTTDQQLSKSIDNELCKRFDELSNENQSYKSFVKVACDIGTELLPPKPKTNCSTKDLP